MGSWGSPPFLVHIPGSGNGPVLNCLIPSEMHPLLEMQLSCLITEGIIYNVKVVSNFSLSSSQSINRTECLVKRKRTSGRPKVVAPRGLLNGQMLGKVPDGTPVVLSLECFSLQVSPKCALTTIASMQDDFESVEINHVYADSSVFILTLSESIASISNS